MTRTVTYYPVAGAMSKIPRPAGRINITGGSNTMYYVLKDHLGSASVVTDSTGIILGEQRYYPYGETRFTSGTNNTDKLFTGQHEMLGSVNSVIYSSFSSSSSSSSSSVSSKP